MQIVTVTKEYNNQKLSVFLMQVFPELNINTLYKALRKKDIRINNVRINENIIIHTGDEVKVFIVDELLYKEWKFKTVYEDKNILIIYKPNGIKVTGSNSLTEYLSKSYNFIQPCHRLDMNTTGLVLFAKNKDSLEILLEKFKNKEIEKHYITTVYGIPNKDYDTLTAYLFKDRKKAMVYISSQPKKGYSKIITSYTILKKNKENNTSVLDVELHTGKTHQIRAHLAYIGYPIIGDGKYGINKINKQFSQNTQMLCSYILKFNFTTPAGILDYLNNKTIQLDGEQIRAFF